VDASRWSAFADPLFRNYTQENGLPNQASTSIAEDGNGFLWVGTQGGLARWDGYRFRVYQPEARTQAIPDSWITTLHTDPLGRLWVGTSGGGLARYDCETDSFTTYRAGPQALSSVHVTAIADDGASGLWIATTGGLDHFDHRTEHFTTLRHRASDPRSLPDDRIRAVLLDRQGCLWVGPQSGAACRVSGSDNFVTLEFASVGAQAPADSGIQLLRRRDRTDLAWDDEARRLYCHAAIASPQTCRG
jgi:ligand-binding sensor domain-containing protein